MEQNENRIFYTDPDGHLGDVIPYYEDGEFKLFYLEKGWTSVTTKDQLHFYNNYRTTIRGGTGSIVKVDGVYHLFYCKFPGYPYPRQYACHATSTDYVNWTEHPEHTFGPDGDIYEMSDWRDPHVIWNEDEQCWWMLLAWKARVLFPTPSISPITWTMLSIRWASSTKKESNYAEIP